MVRQSLLTGGGQERSGSVDRLDYHVAPRDCGRANAILAGCELAAHVLAADGRGSLVSSCVPVAYGGRQASH